jgi:hypothetical protein
MTCRVLLKSVVRCCKVRQALIQEEARVGSRWRTTVDGAQKTGRIPGNVYQCLAEN